MHKAPQKLLDSKTIVVRGLVGLAFISVGGVTFTD